MDMEVVQPFDPLLTHDLMLSYENHISENLEAGCFGAVKGHQYIKKCMEYFENNNFFDPSERDKIMNMPICERHDYIDPLILPEIMKKAFEHFKDKGYRIYSREYFTAKNIVTGEIEQTRNTFTIHHFATQYHSPEWRKGREIKQKISRIFGEKTLISKILHKILAVTDRIKRYGITKSLEYYIDKYIVTIQSR
jgi:predicted Fe-Mo cluster-binding NifX family protein